MKKFILGLSKLEANVLLGVLIMFPLIHGLMVTSFHEQMTLWAGIAVATFIAAGLGSAFYVSRTRIKNKA